jgi:ankyrin repeat protein
MVKFNQTDSLSKENASTVCKQREIVEEVSLLNLSPDSIKYIFSLLCFHDLMAIGCVYSQYRTYTQAILLQRAQDYGYQDTTRETYQMAREYIKGLLFRDLKAILDTNHYLRVKILQTNSEDPEIVVQELRSMAPKEIYELYTQLEYRSPGNDFLTQYFLKLVEDGFISKEKITPKDTFFVSLCRKRASNRVKLLLAIGVDFNLHELPALHCAAFEGDHDTVAVLLDYDRGAHINDRYLGDLPLNFAAAAFTDPTKKELEIHETIRVLLEYGADPNSTGSSGRCPLSHAVNAMQFETIDLLLEHGADINALCPRDGGGTTTMLFRAVWMGNKKLVRLLLERGADPNIPMTDGKGGAVTLLQYAEKNGFNKIVELLQNQNH